MNHRMIAFLRFMLIIGGLILFFWISGRRFLQDVQREMAGHPALEQHLQKIVPTMGKLDTLYYFNNYLTGSRWRFAVDFDPNTDSKAAPMAAKIWSTIKANGISWWKSSFATEITLFRQINNVRQEKTFRFGH
jgi:hypothetical protein